MVNFEYYTPTKVVFGKDTQSRVGELVKAYGGTKVLLHYGGQSAVRSGLLNAVKESLEKEGIEYVELGGVVPNPHLGKVREGIALGKNENVDFILAVGGGSVIDSAKAIGYGLAEPEYDVWELFEYTREAKACLPIGAVLTIAAAGSEMSMGSVITDEQTGNKRAYDTDICRPKFAVMNPELTMTLPDYQTMSGCVDIMMHMMERYFSSAGAMEVTDGMAEHLLRKMMEKAEVLHQEPQNYEARAEVMWAGSLAHNGLLSCGNDGGDWSTHMLEHELGGMFDVTHGAGLAALWPSWARYVHKDLMPRFVKFSLNVMQVEAGVDDEETVERGIQAMEAFYRRIAMPTNMTELGIDPTEEQVAVMAKACSVASGGEMGSAKRLREADMLAIYKMAK